MQFSQETRDSFLDDRPELVHDRGPCTRQYTGSTSVPATEAWYEYFSLIQLILSLLGTNLWHLFFFSCFFRPLSSIF